MPKVLLAFRETTCFFHIEPDIPPLITSSKKENKQTSWIFCNSIFVFINPALQVQPGKDTNCAKINLFSF